MRRAEPGPPTIYGLGRQMGFRYSNQELVHEGQSRDSGILPKGKPYLYLINLITINIKKQS